MDNTVEPENSLMSVGRHQSKALVGKTLLMIMSVPFYEAEGQSWLDEQTCNCVLQWAQNFERVVLACPILPKHINRDNVSLGRWSAIADLPCAEQLELVPLPYAYKIQDFIVFQNQSNLIKKYLTGVIK